jgi:hypothetical protein
MHHYDIDIEEWGRLQSVVHQSPMFNYCVDLHNEIIKTVQEGDPRADEVEAMVFHLLCTLEQEFINALYRDLVFGDQ